MQGLDRSEGGQAWGQRAITPKLQGTHSIVQPTRLHVKCVKVLVWTIYSPGLCLSTLKHPPSQVSCWGSLLLLATS